MTNSIPPEKFEPTDAETAPTSGNTTHDLRHYAEEALRMLQQSADPSSFKKPATPPSQITPEVVQPENTTYDLAKAAQEAMDQVMQAQQKTPPTGQMIFTETMLLRLEVVDSTNPLVVDIRGEMTLGRSDNATSYIPEIDLTRHGAYRLGLSRKHAVLRRKGQLLELLDMGSRNGTIINGDKLAPHDTRIIHDGDEVQFGNLTLRMIFQKR